MGGGHNQGSFPRLIESRWKIGERCRTEKNLSLISGGSSPEWLSGRRTGCHGTRRQSTSEAVSLPAHKADRVAFNLELPVGSYCTWIASQTPCGGFLAPTCLQLAHFTLAAVPGAHGARSSSSRLPFLTMRPAAPAYQSALSSDVVLMVLC